MIRFVTDQNLDNDVLRGLLRRLPDLDIVRVQDLDLARAIDSEILSWAQQQGRIVLTHDVSTMTAEAYSRLRERLPMAGVCIVPQLLSIGQAIEDLLLIAECSVAKDWENQVRYLPL